MKMLNNKQKPLSAVSEYLKRIIYSKPSVLRRVCCKCRMNKSTRYYSLIDLKKGPGKSMCCDCVKKNLCI